ncbi:serine protease inhibitor dipetalogastin-like [Anopheles aquasalis]|uniref:serine protease inhibitor dipetalogastin-like n=1 Tax=Anopheles aquasalis TaxID=42839 RepID=UPI00215A4A20|nr:serine protease inhibitor dipetalogastin-like [Anopheles aquasalis]
MRSISAVVVLALAVVVILAGSSYGHGPGSKGGGRGLGNENCMCGRIYKPVCGSDLKTYANQCLLDCHAAMPAGRQIGLKFLRDGRCKEGEKRNKGGK